mmetsp:Transcript_34307/g.70244  ORF Transcript_34307/g.70244 Transcript_34307/m.70244 type:complete len:116 (-) Transcript_34307:131-478(-)
MLKALVEVHGNEWLKISKEMPSRDRRQCQQRWNNHLDPNKKERSSEPQKRKECERLNADIAKKQKILIGPMHCRKYESMFMGAVEKHTLDTFKLMKESVAYLPLQWGRQGWRMFS